VTDGAPRKPPVSTLVLFAYETDVYAASLRSWAGALDRAMRAKSWEEVLKVRSDLVAAAAGLDAIAREALRKAEG
jgi:hypothetical protein